MSLGGGTTAEAARGAVLAAAEAVAVDVDTPAAPPPAAIGKVLRPVPRLAAGITMKMNMPTVTV